MQQSALAQIRAALVEAFTAAYGRRYGRSEAMPVEVLSWRMVVEGPRPPLGAAMGRHTLARAGGPSPHGSRPVWFEDGYRETPVYHRGQFAPGDRLTGPAIIEETESTTVVPPDFTLSVDDAVNLVLHREGA